MTWFLRSGEDSSSERVGEIMRYFWVGERTEFEEVESRRLVCDCGTDSKFLNGSVGGV